MDWRDLKTPAALIDLDRLEKNTSRMSDRIHRLGGRLRPHVKTHKSPDAARFQVRGHFGGITVSTLAEARVFAESGFRDITYAVPIAPSKIEEAETLARNIDRLGVLLDHEQVLNELEACAKARDTTFSIFLKIDCGYHRAGVDPNKEESIKLALRLDSSPFVIFLGILTHAGHSYECDGPDAIRVVAEQERSEMVKFASRLEQVNVVVQEVSVGSTPTMSLTESLAGVTEARPGNYAFYDRFQASIGSCTLEDVAFSILVSVSSHYPDTNKMLIDAGALAFSTDAGPTHLDPNCGFGAVFSDDGARQFPKLRLESLSQEHGKVSSDEPIDFEACPIGSKLRVIPNHSCLAAALYETYYVVRNDEIVDEWKPVKGW